LSRTLRKKALFLCWVLGIKYHDIYLWKQLTLKLSQLIIVQYKMKNPAAMVSKYKQTVLVVIATLECHCEENYFERSILWTAAWL